MLWQLDCTCCALNVKISKNHETKLPADKENYKSGRVEITGNLYNHYLRHSFNPITGLARP